MTHESTSPTPEVWPTVGMVVPPGKAVVPPEAHELFPRGVHFIARGLHLAEMRPPAYGRALENLEAAVGELIEAGADAISLMGTSISFYRGRAGHEEIHGRLTELAQGRPTSTMAIAIVRGLESVGARRVALGSAYIDTVADALGTFLTEMGFTVEGSANLGIASIEDLRRVDDRTLIDLGERLLSAHTSADALLLSCGGLHTAVASRELEERYNVPVISSAQAGCWDAVNLVAPELSPRLSGVR